MSVDLIVNVYTETLKAVSLSGTDSDGIVVSFKLTTLPTNGNFYLDAGATTLITLQTVISATPNVATIHYKSNPGYVGADSFQYAAVDDEGLQDPTPANGNITVLALQLWIQSTPVANTGNLRDVIYSTYNGRWLAAGGSGAAGSVQLITALNTGTSWANNGGSQPAAVSQIVNRIAYFGGTPSYYLALTSGGLVYSATAASNAQSWIARSALSIVGQYYDVVQYYSTKNSMMCFLFVGAGGKVSNCYDDFATNFARTSSFTAAQAIYAANTIGTLLVVAGAGGKINTYPKARPADSMVYTARTSQFGTSDIYGLKLCNGALWAVGADGKMSYSSNGTAWTAVANTSFEGTAIRSIAYGAGRYVAVGDGGKIAVSTDGVNWTQQANTFDSTNLRSIAFATSKFVAVGDNGKVGYWIP